MKMTFNGVARFYVDIDADIWSEDELKLWGEVYAEVDTLEELAEDVLRRYVNGDRELPNGITITENEVYIDK